MADDGKLQPPLSASYPTEDEKTVSLQTETTGKGHLRGWRIALYLCSTAAGLFSLYYAESPFELSLSFFLFCLLMLVVGGYLRRGRIALYFCCAAAAILSPAFVEKHNLSFFNYCLLMFIIAL